MMELDFVRFQGVLTIVFVILKLMGFIDWQWGWVLAPLWVPFVLVLTIIGAVLMWKWVTM